MTHLTISYEALYHYSCGHCKRWWSVADIQPTPGTTVTCPHCHAAHQVPEVMQTGQEGVSMLWTLEGWVKME